MLVEQFNNDCVAHSLAASAPFITRTAASLGMPLGSLPSACVADEDEVVIVAAAGCALAILSAAVHVAESLIDRQDMCGKSGMTCAY